MATSRSTRTLPAASTSTSPPETGAALIDHWTLFGPDYMPYRLLLTGRLIDRLTTQHVREVADFALAEWRVLAHLSAMGEKSASAVSTAALVDRSEVSRAVATLVARGLIDHRPNPRNRKSRLLFLTDAGKAQSDSLQRLRAQFFAEITADLSREDRATIDRLLLKIAQRAEAIELGGTLPRAAAP